ncbi:modulator protein [Pantoea septica]|uniref:modulator protein n=1 Tax=Pantoea septica TaxID=472695 RepID=UPI0023F6F6B4|nr:modulator protein [Pantoea septica]
MSDSNLKHGTLSRLQKIADPFGVTVFREGAQRCLKLKKGDQTRIVVDLDNKEVPQGVRSRSYEQWERIIKENAELLNQT